MATGHSPLDQFKIKALVPIDFAGLDVSFTNSSLYMVIAVTLVTLFFTLSMRGRALVPGRWQSLAEVTYEFIAGTLRDTVGSEGRRYFPFIFTAFMFVLMANLLGMTPFGFTTTSHIIVTFALAFFIFIMITVVSIYLHGSRFFAHFLPEGTPWWLAPLMILIEVFSYLSRPISLSVRLSANMMAGHVLLKVIAGFVTLFITALGAFNGTLAGILPFAFVVGLTGFEIFIAILQAYIFTVLTCVYLNGAIHMH